MFGDISTTSSATPTTADRHTPSVSSNFTGDSWSAVPRTATASSAASAMSSSPVHPQTPTDTFYFEETSESCSLDPDQWNPAYGEKDDEDDHIEVSDVLPTPAELEKAGSMLIYDAHGVARPFKSLYMGHEHQGSRQMLSLIHI